MSGTYSFSNTFKLTPPRNPNKPPIIAVIISTASIWYASHDANVEKNVAHKMATNTWGRIFPNSILAINLIRVIKIRHITRIIPLFCWQSIRPLGLQLYWGICSQVKSLRDVTERLLVCGYRCLCRTIPSLYSF